MVAARLSLDTIEIASPCSVSWEQMHGTERVRYCPERQLQVYNLSDMSREEVERFLQETVGNERTCPRFYRRADGTILPEDCLGGPRAARRLTAAMMFKVAVFLGVACCGFALLFGLMAIEAASSPPPLPPASELPMWGTDW
jgi:hypothetical protein